MVFIAMTQLKYNTHSDCNVNAFFHNFNQIFNQIIRKHAPFRFVTKNEKKVQLNPWISKGVRKSIKLKNN